VPNTEHGLRVESDSVYIRHISISGAFTHKANILFSGVSFGGVFDSRINEDGLDEPLALTGNHIGLDLVGNTARPNGTSLLLNSGVAVRRCPGDSTNPNRQLIIGGSQPNESLVYQAYPNMISGNTGNGISLQGSGVRNVQLRYNKIGTNVAGNAAVPNGLSGVSVGSGAQHISIGIVSTAAFPQPRCIIGGNTGTGVIIGGVGEGEVVASDVRVVNCAVGTTEDGTLDQANGDLGLNLFGNIKRVVVEKSVIAAASTAGVRINTNAGNDLDLANVTLQDNFIGVNAAEAGFFFANQVGVEIAGGPNSAPPQRHRR
jgi:hypothetical protein